MQMEQQDPGYFSYLLRLYQMRGQTGWRASLENPHNGQKLFFLNLEQLFSYLQEQCEPEESSSGASECE